MKNQKVKLRDINVDCVLSLPGGKHYIIPNSNVLSFFQQNSPETYRAYVRGVRLSRAGGALMTIASISLTGGLAIMYTETRNKMPGLIMIGASAIPTIIAACLLSYSVDLFDVYNKSVSQNFTFVNVHDDE